MTRFANQGSLLPTPEQASRQLLAAAFIAVALFGVPRGVKELFGDDPAAKRALPDAAPQVQTVNYGSPDALATNEHQVVIDVQPGEGPATLAARAVTGSVLNSTDEMRENVIAYLKKQQADGYQPDDQVTLPREFVVPQEAVPSDTELAP